MLLLEENEPPSPIAWTAELSLGRVIALNTSNAITPTMSKTVKNRINRSEWFFLHPKLAL